MLFFDRFPEGFDRVMGITLARASVSDVSHPYKKFSEQKPGRK